MTSGAINRTGRVVSVADPATYSVGLRSKLLAILFITWMLPIHPILAGQRLDPYRLVLLILFIPFLVSLFRRKAGWFTTTDGLILCFGGWIILTMVYHHGMSKFAFGTIIAVEMFGGYAAGRLLVRSPQDFRRYVKFAMMSLLFLLPFVVIELVSGRMLIGELFSRVFPVSEKYMETRYGLYRVQGVFPHAILYGLYCSINAANVVFLYRDSLLRLVPRFVLVVFMTMASLSSAPTLSVIIQAMVFMWGVLTRNRWKLLLWLVIAGIVFLEFASNRGPVILFIETFTLDPQTGWWRYYIWLYGLDSVWASPVVGIGLNDWARPSWMAAVSVDNFWLLIAMRHGLVGFGLLVAGLVVHIWRVTRAKSLSPEAQTVRTGYMIGLVGLCFTLSTVHVWDVLAVYVMFYFGAGSFLYTSDTTTGPAPDAAPKTAAPQRGRGRAPVVYARSFPRPDATSSSSKDPR